MKENSQMLLQTLLLISILSSTVQPAGAKSSVACPKGESSPFECSCVISDPLSCTKGECVPPGWIAMLSKLRSGTSKVIAKCPSPWETVSEKNCGKHFSIHFDFGPGQTNSTFLFAKTEPDRPVGLRRSSDYPEFCGNRAATLVQGIESKCEATPPRVLCR